MKRELRLEGNRPFALQSPAMGLLSLFKSKSADRPEGAAAEEKAPALAPQKAVAPLWRRNVFKVFPAGEELHLIALDGGVPLALPSYVVDFALHCDEFHPLEKHLAEHAERHGLNGLQLDALQAWIPRLIEMELLISTEAVRAKCAAMIDPENHPPAVELVGFPTGGNRLAMLERCLTSFGANLQKYRPDVELFVADSSPAPEQRAAFRELLRRLKREYDLPLRYAGEEEKRRFAEALIAHSGVRASSVEFALFDPLGAGFTCGANRNALLLHEAGRMTVSVDDDVICEMASMAQPEYRVALFAQRDPCDRHFFADRASALVAAPFVEADFLGVHHTLLGRDIGTLFPPDLTADEIDVSRTDDDMLRRISREPVRLRATYFGQVGDTGTPTSCYYFYCEGEALQRLTSSEALYREAFQSRSVVAGMKNPAIGGGLMTPGMSIGLDHRELLPPFFPVLHAEDVVFGAATWICCPQSAAGHLPFAIHHDSGADKTIHQPRHLTADERATVFEFALIVRSLLFKLAPPASSDVAERMRRLGRNLVAFAERPAREFVTDFQKIVVRMEAAKLTYLEDRLREETSAPDFWRRDLEAFIVHSREALTHADFDIPFDLKPHRSAEENRALMQQLLLRYGQLLEDWPAIVAAAQTLRAEGGPFSVEVRAD